MFLSHPWLYTLVPDTVAVSSTGPMLYALSVSYLS